MSETAIVYHDDFLKHCQVQHHPECPQRLQYTIEHFQKTGLMDVVAHIDPEPAPIQDVELVHSHGHVEYIKSLSEQGRGKFSIIDPDTYVCKSTYDVALLAAGGVIEAAKAVWRGEVGNCYALIRPPGHHASVNQATGFCYFDNVAVAVKHLQNNQGMKKAVIFDWDAHAPNGTMGTFYQDPTVLNMSIHQDPHSFFPGHGFVDQIGEGAGRGYTVNFPVPPGCGDGDFLFFIDEYVLPRIRKFNPDMVFVSAGQDSHISDAISRLNVTDAGYAAMTKRFMQVADEVCDGKLVLELEGGYNVQTLPETNKVIVEQLMGSDYGKTPNPKLNPQTKDILQKLQDAHQSSRIWSGGPDYGEAQE